ncbi:hypothetical protein CERZMDRAFT_103284 [Cercospora zeae-maydis SCOH1-5]|uniref:Uncharacterized protein n=1 Tax=Cercospora zeae-maydis SCOH1-5 TaxID=717836 RepID=A0A6A6F1W2_9PEZI|nr:hypothetical protein CERZMDRAFT_103284 [Cercospora zeae-maydis SCOH1-5]
MRCGSWRQCPIRPNELGVELSGNEPVSGAGQRPELQHYAGSEASLQRASTILKPHKPRPKHETPTRPDLDHEHHEAAALQGAHAVARISPVTRSPVAAHMTQMLGVRQQRQLQVPAASLQDHVIPMPDLPCVDELVMTAPDHFVNKRDPPPVMGDCNHDLIPTLGTHLGEADGNYEVFIEPLSPRGCIIPCGKPRHSRPVRGLSCCT